MIRFIVSDVDGTLVSEGGDKVSDRLISQIPQLKNKGILFGVASGRNYDELVKLFEPVKRDMLFITNNGAVVIFDGEIVCKNVIDRRTALDIVKDVESQVGFNALIGGEKSTYVLEKNIGFMSFMLNDMKYNPLPVKEIYKIHEDISKISVHQYGGLNRSKYEEFEHKWSYRAKLAISGDEWFDFTAPGVSKGSALANVQRLYQIAAEDTMTFGDNYNDIEMFEHSYFSYAMQHSEAQIRNAAKHIAVNVEDIIEDIIRM